MLKLQNFGYLVGRADLGKDPDVGKERKQQEGDVAEDAMIK